jgi:hypothetical protein
VKDLLKNEAAIYSETNLTEAQATMRLLLLRKLAVRFGLRIFEKAFVECLLDREYRPKPAHIKKQIMKILEIERLEEAAAVRGSPVFKQLPDCKNNCGEEEGVYRVSDPSGNYVGVCDCLRAHWRAGGQRLLWMKPRALEPGVN